MALIRFKKGGRRFVTPEQGLAIWQVMNGEIEGSEEQRHFVSSVERVYLNRTNAPASYLAAYKDPRVRFETVRLETAPAAGSAEVEQTRLPYKDS